MKRPPLALSLSLLAVAALHMSPVAAQTTAAGHIAQGRTALSKQTPDGIAEALTAFDAAVTAEPGNAEANFFKAAALLLQEAGSAEFRKQFSDIGVNISPDLYKFSLVDAYTPGHRGIFLPSGNATTDAHLAYLNSKETLLAEVLKHLEKITDSNFNVTLSATETALLQTQVDYADVCLLRAGVHLAKAAIALGNSYNVTAQYKKLYDLFEDEKLNPEAVMKEFPLLLTFSPTPDRRLSAKTSFKAAYSEWAKAYPLLKDRSVGDSSGALFGFESAAYVQELNDVYFSVMNTALDSAATLSLIDPYDYFPQEPKLNLSSLFSTSQAPRFYFPTVFDRGYFRPNAWSDPTFGGIFPQGTQSYATDLGVASWLVQYSVYEPYEFRLLVGDPNKWGYYDEDQKTPLFRYINSIAVDEDGNLYVADADNHVIRKITTDDTIYTVVGTKWSSGNELSKLYQYSGSGGYRLPRGVLQWMGPIAVSKDGTIFFTNENQIWKQTPDGVMSALAGKESIPVDGIGSDAGFGDISAMTVGPDGAVYLCDENAIRKVEANGRVTTIAGELGWDSIGGYKNGSASEARFKNPNGIAVAADGTIFVSEEDNGCIRRISTNGTVDTYVGYGPLGALGWWFYRDAQGSEARCHPAHLAIDNEGNLYFEEAGTIRKVNKDRVVRTIGGYWGESELREGVGEGARIPSYGNGIAVDRRGTLYVAYNNFILTAESIVNPFSGDPFPEATQLPEDTAKPEVQTPEQSIPQLLSLTLSTNTIDLSNGAVEVPFKAITSGTLHNLNFNFSHSLSNASIGGSASNGFGKIYFGGLEIQDYTKEGLWTLNRISYTDPISYDWMEIAEEQIAALGNISFTISNPVVDETIPTIHSLTLLSTEANTSNSSAKIRYRVQISDNLSGFSWLDLSFWNPVSYTSINPNGMGAWNSLVAVDGVKKTYEGTIEVPQGTAEGDWILQNIWISDKAGNVGSVTLTPELQAVKFTVNSTASNPIEPQDQFAPWPVALNLEKTSVDVSAADQKVKVQLAINNDDLPTNYWISVSFYMEHGYGYENSISVSDFQLVSGTVSNGIYEGNLVIPQYSKNGNYTITSIDISENNQFGNYKTFNRWRDSIPSEFRKTISVSGTQDVTAPILQSIAITPSSADTRNGTVSVMANLTITDDLSGVQKADLFTDDHSAGAIALRSPSGKEFIWSEFNSNHLISGNSTHGTYQVQFDLPQYSEEGAWEIDYIEMVDKNYNTRFLIPPNLTAEQIAASKIQVQGWPRGWEQQAVTVQATTKGNATIQLGNLTQTADGTPKVPSVLASPGNLTQNVTLTYDGVTTPPVDAGTYTVVAYVNDPNYQGREVATLTIKAPAPQSPAQPPSGGGGGGASSGGGGAPAAEKSKKGGKKSGGGAKKSSDSSKKSAAKKSGGDSKKSSAKKSGGGSKKSSAKKSSGGSKGGKSKKSGGKKK